MPDDEFRRLVDGDEEERASIRFGRSRFLRIMGGALFALVGGAMLPDTAHAAPYPCYGYPGCTRCCGCGGGCTKAYTCEGSKHCWYTATATATYKCCDWRLPNGSLCIMSTRIAV